MKYVIFMVFLFCNNWVLAGQAKLNVLTCEPEWAALANALGGDLLKIHSATTAQQDPHHIQARPSLIAKARKADLVICSGAELETGWLPLLLRKSGNPNIQPGKLGHFMATDFVPLLGKSDAVDRSQGDVHAAGNPHIQLDPVRMMRVAEQLAKVMSQLLPQQQDTFLSNLASLQQQMDAALQALSADIQLLQGKSIVVHHNSWVYMCEWLGMSKAAELEPKPGLPPTSSHLSGLIKQLRDHSVYAVVYAQYQDDKPSHWLGSRVNLPVLGLPNTVADWKQPDALVNFYRLLVKQLVEPMNKPTTASVAG